MQDHIERLEELKNMANDQLQDFTVDCMKTLMKNKTREIIEFPRPMEDVYCDGEDIDTTVYGLQYDSKSNYLYALCEKDRYHAEEFDADTLIIMFYKIVDLMEHSDE